MALDAEQIQKTRSLLMSSGWNDVLKPLLAVRAHNAVKALILSPAERDGEFKDMADTELRARIREAEWILSVLPNEVAVYDHNRRLDELDRQTDPDGSTPSTANP